MNPSPSSSLTSDFDNIDERVCLYIPDPLCLRHADSTYPLRNGKQRVRTRKNECFTSYSELGGLCTFVWYGDESAESKIKRRLYLLGRGLKGNDERGCWYSITLQTTINALSIACFIIGIILLSTGEKSTCPSDQWIKQDGNKNQEIPSCTCTMGSMTVTCKKVWSGDTTNCVGVFVVGAVIWIIWAWMSAKGRWIPYASWYKHIPRRDVEMRSRQGQEGQPLPPLSSTHFLISAPTSSNNPMYIPAVTEASNDPNHLSVQDNYHSHSQPHYQKTNSSHSQTQFPQIEPFNPNHRSMSMELVSSPIVRLSTQQQHDITAIVNEEESHSRRGEGSIMMPQMSQQTFMPIDNLCGINDTMHGPPPHLTSLDDVNLVLPPPSYSSAVGMLSVDNKNTQQVSVDCQPLYQYPNQNHMPQSLHRPEVALQNQHPILNQNPIIQYQPYSQQQQTPLQAQTQYQPYQPYSANQYEPYANPNQF